MFRRGAPFSCFLWICLLAPIESLEAEAPKGGWDKAVQGLQKAVRERNEKAAKSYVKLLVATGEAKGYRSIIRYGLGTDDYVIFSYVAGYLARITDPEMREVVFAELEKNRNPRSKIVLLAVVKRWVDDKEAMKALHGRLSDRRKEVVFTAIRWIKEINKPEISMPRLIAELARREKGPRGRVYFDLRKTLTFLTEEDFDLAADWKNYWATRASGVKPPKREGGRTALFKRPSFFSVSLDSDRVIFVIDISGSMEIEDEVTDDGDEEPEFVGKGTTVVKLRRTKKPADDKPRKRSRISAVKEELVRTLGQLPSSVKFNILSFNHEHSLFDPSGELIQASKDNTKKAISWVKGLAASGATRTDLVLAESLKLPDVDTVILLTDGAPKRINNEKIPPEEVFRVVDHFNRFRKARITTIGFVQAGFSMRQFVQELAARNDGQCILLK